MQQGEHGKHTRYGDSGPDGMFLIHPNTQEDLCRETQHRHDQREQPWQIMRLVGPSRSTSLRTVPFDPSPSSWGDTSGIIQHRLKMRDFGPTPSSSTNSLAQSSSEPGDISKIPRQDEGADRGAHAEDQRDVRKDEEILERDCFDMLHKIRRCFEVD
jgi:hypothetical protein